MRSVFLIIIAVLLLCSSMPLLGLGSLGAALLFKKDGERLWCLFLGIMLLMAFPTWFLAGIISLVFVFTEN